MSMLHEQASNSRLEPNGDGSVSKFQIGRRVAAMRKRAGLNQPDLSGRLGVSEGRVSRIEARGASLPTLARVAEALGCSLEWLVGSESPLDADLPARENHDSDRGLSDEEFKARAARVLGRSQCKSSGHQTPGQVERPSCAPSAAPGAAPTGLPASRGHMAGPFGVELRHANMVEITERMVSYSTEPKL